MTRTETFKNTSPNHPESRAFVALLQGIERTNEGKDSITSCMYFFDSTAEGAAEKASSFVASEIRKAVEAEELAKKRAEARRKSA